MPFSATDAKRAAGRLVPSGTIGDPLPILSPQREPAGWFVPLLDDDALHGFMQFDRDLTFLRESKFSKPVDARTWLDVKTIVDRALQTFRGAQPNGDPFLTYDANVTRLVWAVPVDGGTIYVAGEFAYQAAT